MKKVPPIICVAWEDPCTYSEWTYRKDAEKKKAQEVLSIGFLVSEDEDYITLALDVSTDEEGDEQFNAYAVIPKGCVRRRRTVKAPLKFSKNGKR
jgi:hypothetical protein